MKSFTALAVFVMSMASVASAADLNLELKASTLQTNSTELVMSFQDHEPVSGTCPLYVERMEYVAALDTLMVTMQPTLPCLREDYGRREGTLKWSFPANLSPSKKLKVVLNGKTLTSLVIASGTVIQTQP